ncbi:hypothetical protein JGI3_02242 [Candidatus Kryptobacter tengchongensis]|nr:hypothetical protein JGI3_02242 [Candidatus Kryptobacter tengchongensis]
MEAKGSLSGGAIQRFQELLKKLFQSRVDCFAEKLYWTNSAKPQRSCGPLGGSLRDEPFGTI